MRRPPPAASLVTLVAIAILCTLGTWQVQRLQWKTGLLTQLDHAYADPAPSFFTSSAIAAAAPSQEFAAARLHGRFLTSAPLLLGVRTWQGQAGYHVVAALRLRDGGIVLINRGWVPLNPSSVLLKIPTGSVTVRGILHRPDRDNPFVPPNDPAHGRWYRWDLPQMAAALKVPTVAPMILYAQDTDSANQPVTAALRWTLPNHHLYYAGFWFSMAAVLAVIFFIRFVRQA